LDTNTKKYRNNCTLPLILESTKTTYFIRKKPTGKLMRKANISEAICGLKA